MSAFNQMGLVLSRVGMMVLFGWDLNEVVITTFSSPLGGAGTAFSIDGSLIARGQDGMVLVWSARVGSKIRTICVHKSL